MNPNKSERQIFRAGLDVGSTTAKLLLLDENGQTVFSLYRRHKSDIEKTLAGMFAAAEKDVGDCSTRLSVTGSAGMGIAEGAGMPFIQEVVAAGEVVQSCFPDVRTLFDIGGEDSKMLFLSPGRPPDIRMNGSCAGGTGAFIDQMAALLDLSLTDLNRLASEHNTLYPIASRCGVFAKTDVQNLISRKIDIADICASILQAVVLQNLNTLTRGTDIQHRILLCGGPLTFLPALRERFCDCLGISAEDVLDPGNGHFFPAWGAALRTPEDSRPRYLSEWHQRLGNRFSGQRTRKQHLPPLFDEKMSRRDWEAQRPLMRLQSVSMESAAAPFFLGIDAGSTTTKVMAFDQDQRVIFSDYRPNRGNPVDAVLDALTMFYETLSGCSGPVSVVAGAVTGYGEDLVRAALDLDLGIVETIAHWRAAAECNPEVSFILDIGGQDMKAIFVRGNGIQRIEINEACSSGCGSFIEGFAQSLGLTVEDFADGACRACAPSDLGTRCTVFMNSRIKQAQRENADINDIAAGLAYAVIKNSLYKVLKLRDPSELGSYIVVQGGTFRNPAVLRALELLTGCRIASSDHPEMMGAYGAALLAKEAYEKDPGIIRPVDLAALSRRKRISARQVFCSGCTNGCAVTVFTFGSGRRYYVGNRCENIFSNRGEETKKGSNLFTERNRLLFDRSLLPEIPSVPLRVGIPRILGMFETFPFWSTLLTGCGFEVVLSEASSDAICRKGLGTVMADNICFPAKLAHGHVVDLVEKGVDRIFYPMVLHERKEQAEAENSFNCPIVASYAEVLESVIHAAGSGKVAFDTPTVSFGHEDLLRKSCLRYIRSIGGQRRRFHKAFQSALAIQVGFNTSLLKRGADFLRRAGGNQRPLIVLAGRPYHVDPFIEHQTSDMLANLGADVVPADVAAHFSDRQLDELTTLSQWAFPNRLLKAAQWVAEQPDVNIQYVMLNSFGCGPDAFIMDEIRDVLAAGGKIFTLVRIDEIASTGSTRLRLRSLMETLKWQPSSKGSQTVSRTRVPLYLESDRSKPIIAPHFAESYAPFFVPIFRLAGYDLRILPPSDKESVEYGLKYANNEICYPATLIIGDIIKAFKTGGYDPSNTAATMTQTGGQCRASSYIALMKKALISAGYPDVPVVAAASSESLMNEQPGFDFDVESILKPSFTSIIYADAIARMYYATAVREQQPGMAARLRDQYQAAGTLIVESGGYYDGLLELLKKAVRDFNDALATTAPLPRIGIVGEIFLKYNRFSQMGTVDWLMSQGVEAVVAPLADFVMQFFINDRFNRRNWLSRGNSGLLLKIYMEVHARSQLHRFERILQGFQCYTPAISIYKKARTAKEIVSLANQYGEGWLIPAEIAGFAREGIWDVVCLQPFGCIANHVIAKGIENKVKRLYPMVNLLFLDFDGGASEVNVQNRLHFMVRSSKDHRRSA